MLEEQPASGQLSPEEEVQLNNLIGSRRQSSNPLRPSGAGEGSNLSDQDQSQLDFLINSRNKPTMKAAASAEAPASLVARLERPVAGAEELEQNWGETLQGAGKNLLPSSGRLIKETAKALTVNLPETAEGIGQIISGLSSKVGGNFGLEQTPEEKQKKEAVVDALGKHYADTYGGLFRGDTKAFKKAFAEDPASILADLSLPLSGGAGILAKTAKAGSLTQKALALTAKGAQYLDPIQGAVGVARLATSPATLLAEQIFAKTAQVPPHILDLAKSAGQTTDPALRQAFWSHYTGAADATDIFDTAQSSLKKIKQDASSGYLQSKDGLIAQSKGPISFDKIDKSIEEAFSKIRYQGIENPSLFTDANKALGEVESLVSSWKKVPQAHNLEGFDNLKQAIWDVNDRYKSNNQSRQALGGVYDSVRSSIGDISPDYLKLMENYQTGINEINDITKTLGIGNKASATNALNKMLRQQRTTKGKKLIDVLSEQNPEFSYKLAGATLEPWTQSGARGFIEAALSGVGGLAGWLAFGHIPGVLGTAIASATAQSPKIVGAIPYAVAAARRRLGAPALVGAYTAEQLRPGEEGASPEASAALSSEPRNARNNNPGNIKDGSFVKGLPGYKGSDGTFAVFETPEAGSNALENLLGSYVNRGFNTVSKIIERYSPVGENSSETVKNYINSVAKKLGVDPNQEINLDIIKNLARAISGFEGKEIAATEGRIGRASGGRAVNHADMAEKLVRQAERVKKVQGQGTEALLNHQDDAIISALEIANRHI